MSGRIILVVAILALVLPMLYGFYLLSMKIEGVSQQVSRVELFQTTQANRLLVSPTATPSATVSPSQPAVRRTVTSTPVK